MRVKSILTEARQIERAVTLIKLVVLTGLRPWRDSRSRSALFPTVISVPVSITAASGTPA